MVDVPDEDFAGHFLLLEVTLQAKRVIPFVQHPRIDRAVWRVANDATFTQRFMLIHEWSALGGVTLHAGVICAHEREAAAFDRLLHARAPALDRAAPMRIVAIGATHLSFQHWVSVRQLKLCAQSGVTLETGFRIFVRIDDVRLAGGIASAACLHMEAARTMTTFAADRFGIFAFRHQACMRGRAEIAHNLFVTGLALLHPDVFRAGNARGRHDGAFRRA